MANYEPKLEGCRMLSALALIGWVIAAAMFAIFGDAGLGAIRFAIAIAILALGLGIHALLQALLAIEAGKATIIELIGRSAKRLDEAIEKLDLIRENTLLSEDAKAIAFRRNDVNALRQAIGKEIEEREWEAAYALIDEMVQLFGNREEADQLREEIQQAQEKVYKQDISVEVARVDDLLAARDWDAAAGQIRALQEEHSAQADIAALTDKLDAAKEQHKKWLLQQCNEAVQKNDFDRAVEILKELDRFLTPGEAEALGESARGVFKAKLHALGTQFSLLVSEKLWDQAVVVGQEIIDEFPNSRMATEISERMDALKGKAAEAKQSP